MGFIDSTIHGQLGAGIWTDHNETMLLIAEKDLNANRPNVLLSLLCIKTQIILFPTVHSTGNIIHNMSFLAIPDTNV